jgi:hypothetical protein
MLIANRSVFAANEWETISEDNSTKILMQQQQKLGITCLRVESIIKANALDVFNFTFDLNQRKEWDVVIHSANVIQKIDQNNDIIHLGMCDIGR